ncbi:MAG: hypothetical protein ACM31O_04530 [Bacteroidota bacterium]
MRNDGQAHCIFFTWSRDGQQCSWTPRWGNEEQKVAVLRAMQMAFALLRVERYVNIYEAWMITRPPSEKFDELLPPSQYPDREEVLIGCAADHERIMIAKRVIERKPLGGKIASDVGPTIWSEEQPVSDYSGRLMLLPPRNFDPPEDPRLIARLFDALRACGTRIEPIQEIVAP